MSFRLLPEQLKLDIDTKGLKSITDAITWKNEDAEPQGDTNTVTMGGEDAIYKKRMSGKKKVWDRMDNAIKEKKLKEKISINR
jgi:hypothetical protein